MTRPNVNKPEGFRIDQMQQWIGTEYTGATIRQLREALLLSQDDLAAIIGVTPMTLRRWEATRFPTDRMIPVGYMLNHLLSSRSEVSMTHEEYRTFLRSRFWYVPSRFCD